MLKNDTGGEVGGGGGGAYSNVQIGHASGGVGANQLMHLLKRLQRLNCDY
jgi:hypothetical protein